MHYLSWIYSVTIPLHVSGLLAAHHQEVTMYICNNWYVLYVLVDCQPACFAVVPSASVSLLLWESHLDIFNPAVVPWKKVTNPSLHFVSYIIQCTYFHIFFKGMVLPLHCWGVTDMIHCNGCHWVVVNKHVSYVIHIHII
jgi:hypothetical protein